MKPKVLLTYDKTDVDSRSGVVIEYKLTKLFGIKLKLKTIGEVAAEKVSAKTPASWLVFFQTDTLFVQLRIGKEQHAIGKMDVASVPDPQRRREIIEAIKAEGILDAAEVAQFLRRHPDKARLAELRQALADKLKAIEAMKRDLLALKAELVGIGG